MRLRRAIAGVARASRIVWRLGGLGFDLAGGAVDLIQGRLDAENALHRLCRRLIRRLGLRLTVVGAVPEPGLIVCNHLSYLDVVVLAACAPMGFVAKHEVRSWPVFGWFASRSGTIFVRRGKASDAARSAQAMGGALAAGRRLVLFPEGTSSGGATVLPFKSSLLAPAVNSEVSVAALAYALDAGEGDAGEDVCYWKHHTLVPHLLHLLGRRRIHAALVFGPAAEGGRDRKQRALALHAQVLALKLEAEAALLTEN